MQTLESEINEEPVPENEFERELLENLIKEKGARRAVELLSEALEAVRREEPASEPLNNDLAVYEAAVNAIIYGMALEEMKRTMLEENELPFPDAGFSGDV